MGYQRLTLIWTIFFFLMTGSIVSNSGINLIAFLRKKAEVRMNKNIQIEAACQLRNSLFGTNPRLAARLLSRTGNFFASEPDSLRWIPVRVRYGLGFRASKVFTFSTSEQSSLCSDVLLFLWNKRTSSARSLAPPFQPRFASLDSRLVLGAELKACTSKVFAPSASEIPCLARIPALTARLLSRTGNFFASEPDSLRWIPVRVGRGRKYVH